jgi:hypothetical protein
VLGIGKEEREKQKVQGKGKIWIGAFWFVDQDT